MKPEKFKTDGVVTDAYSKYGSSLAKEIEEDISRHEEEKGCYEQQLKAVNERLDYLYRLQESVDAADKRPRPDPPKSEIHNSNF